MAEHGEQGRHVAARLVRVNAGEIEELSPLAWLVRSNLVTCRGQIRNWSG